MLRDRIKEIAKSKKIPLSKIEADCGFAKGYMSKINESTPSGSKLKQIADYLGVSVDYLMDREEEENYYFSDDARDLANFLFENPEYRVLFDASRNVKKEDIQFVKEFIERMTRKN